MTSQLTLIARLRPGALKVAQDLAAGISAPTEEDSPFDRFGVFVAEDEVVFFLEGDTIGESVRALLDDPVRSTVIARWLPLFDGPLHTARQVYFWERERRQ